MNPQHELMRLIHLLEKIEVNTRPATQFTEEDKTALGKLSGKLEDLVKRFDKLVQTNRKT